MLQIFAAKVMFFCEICNYWAYFFLKEWTKNTTTALSERLWCKISPKANKSILEGEINLRNLLLRHHLVE